MLFLFFSILGEWGGWVLESMENSIHFFFFETFSKENAIKQLFRREGTNSICFTNKNINDDKIFGKDLLSA